MSTLTPANPRMNSPTWGLKLTPSNSPFAKASAARSPIKSSRQDFSLSLKQVIGTTANSANAFDSLSSGRSFAFTAGAAAVIATVGDDGEVSQRFFRARPTTSPLNPTTSVYNPSTSTPNPIDSRSRASVPLRESSAAVSPFASPSGDWADSPNSKSWTAKERVKAATCVSLSPDGKYLAVGETGYKPRVLIFLTSPDASPDTPLTSISDHTFGVCSVAFSPDSQYLATLGASNDGFVHIWKINPRNGSAVLHSSNKCTTTITKMAWLGSNLVTVGIRHVKVWRVEEQVAYSPSGKPRPGDANHSSSSQHKTLQGRPCILGALLDLTFTSVVAIAPNKAIISSEKGDICLLDDTEGSQSFNKISAAEFDITAMALDTLGRLHLAGRQGGHKMLNVHDLISIQTPPQSPSPRPEPFSGALADGPGHIEALATLNSYLVALDSSHAIRLFHIRDPSSNDLLGPVAQQLPAHGDSVLGVDSLSTPNSVDASFYTWSAGGSILFWRQDAKCAGSAQIPLEQAEGSEEFRNELKVVRASSDVSFLAAGDKYGFFSIIDTATQTPVYKIKAHSGEVMDLALHEGKNAFVACAGRDRTVQVFHQLDGTWDLLQTLDEHVGAVTSILFSADGSRLISCSTDRTLVLREAVTCTTGDKSETAFVILRTITLKSTPTAMVFDPEQDDILLVSTVDRQVHRYDLQNGQVISSFKASDADGGDAVVFSAMVTIPSFRGMSLIAGISSTDKSVRLYEDSGYLIKRDWGHTEGVTDIALVSAKSGDDEEPEQRSLVTVAADGTIFIWSLENRVRQQQLDLLKSMDLMGTPPNNSIAQKPPLRRVLSQVELARFQRAGSIPGTPDEVPTPVANRSPLLRKKNSRLTLANSPRLDPPSPSIPSARVLHHSASSNLSDAPARRFYRHRSPSPPSPRSKETAASKARRPSVPLNEARARTKSSNNMREFGSLGSSAEQVCKTLRAFRKKLNTSFDSLTPDTVRELERELMVTAKAVGERAVKRKAAVDEGVMMKLLDQFSEKLVLMMDERLEERIAERMAAERGHLGPVERKGSEAGISTSSQSGVEDGEGSSRRAPTPALSVRTADDGDVPLHAPTGDSPRGKTQHLKSASHG